MGIEKELSVENVFDDDGNYIPVKFAKVNATVGNTTIVVGVTDKKIRVLSIWGLADVAGKVLFESGTGGTALSGDVNVGITGGFVLNHNAKGWFETAAGALLNIQLTTAANFDGTMSYCEL